MNNNNNNKTRGRKRGRTQRKKAVQPIQVPASFSGILSTPKYNISSSDNGQVTRVTGHDLLGSLYRGENIAGVFDMNPACWTNSRLSFIARTYEKYRFNSFTIHYVPSLATSATGFTAMYYEPEIYDNVASAVTQTLTHYTSTAGPCWQPLSMTWKRPVTDQTTYLCTEKTGVERALLSQGKVAVICENTATNPGLLSIDYDITFLYPELEYGYAGVQYEVTQLNLNATANGIIDAGPAFATTDNKLIELTITDPISDLFITVAGNPYAYLAGAVLYTAWDGTSWRLFPDIPSALAKAGALFSVPALTNVLKDCWGRRLVFGSS